MKSSIISKLDNIQNRFEELNILLSESDVIADQTVFVAYSKEYSELEPVVSSYCKFTQLKSELDDLQVLTSDEDPEVAALADEEIKDVEKRLAGLIETLQLLLIPKDPDDSNNVFLEIRAGTGGDEAAIFAGNLYRMYLRYAESKKWKTEVLSENMGEHGGYKEIIARVTGVDIYAHLKFESGAHRVQRVPTTESQGRIHTSACTVAVIPEPGEQEEIVIKKEELRVDTFRSSGAGGQHVNTTDSAIRLTHLPTGTVVECQDERSQHKNRAKAMSLLSARLKNAQRIARDKEIADQRKSLVGSGDRSERIRTYNYPQGRVTDHRINLTLYKLTEIIEGDMDEVISNLRREHQAELLASMVSEGQ